MHDMRSKDTFFSKNLSIKIKGELMDFSTPKVMGILNLSTDSFFDGGRYSTLESISLRIDQIVSEGADIIDIGSVSSRPGARVKSTIEEYDLLKPAVNMVKKKYPLLPVSIDTYNPVVAENMVKEFNVDIINDISSGGESMEMFGVIARYNIPYIIMHMQGTPATMQKDPQYADIISEVLLFFAEKTSKLKSLGISDIIIDPGFGFGKTIDHNYELMSYMNAYQCLEMPILVGISRKSMIYKLLSVDPDKALNGTTALNMIALFKGANILRVHDVREATEVCRLFSKISSSEAASQIV